MLAIELEGKDEASCKLLAARAIHACLAHGVSAVTKPGGALGFSPPLIITEAEIDWTIAQVERAFRAL